MKGCYTKQSTKSTKRLLSELHSTVGNPDELVPPLKALCNQVLRTPISDLSLNDLGDVEAVCAGLVAATRKEKIRRSDMGVMPGWDAARGLSHLNVRDHCYRLVGKQDEITYVSEPYCVTSEGIQELIELSEKGWEVELSSSDSIHYPGHTLAIKLTRESDAE